MTSGAHARAVIQERIAALMSMNARVLRVETMVHVSIKLTVTLVFALMDSAEQTVK